MIFLLLFLGESQDCLQPALAWPQWWSFEEKGQLGVDFCSKISYKKFLIWLSLDREKLAIIWKNKVFQQWKLSKNFNIKKHSPKLIFLNERQNQNIRWFLTLKINSTIQIYLGPFWRLVWKSVQVIQKIYFSSIELLVVQKSTPRWLFSSKTPPLRSR